MTKKPSSDVATEEVENIAENAVAGENYDIIETKLSKLDLEKDGWAQETKEPFLDVDGKLKLLFHKKSFYKYLEVEN